ncbi:MAG: copper chaperone [Thermoleophilia bacterium]|nr:copper chaperone [Thermoleophilia bacterium]
MHGRRALSADRHPVEPGPVFDGAPVSSAPMALRSETLHISGIRCERCVNRLAAALRGHEGLESANANLMGQVTVEFDDEQTSRDELVTAMAKSGFREI